MSNFETITLNNRKFRFSCALISSSVNAQGGETSDMFPVGYNSVNKITVIDDLFNPFMSAEVVLKAPGNFSENSPNLKFRYTSNNRNLIGFYIEPEDTAELPEPNNKLNQLYLLGNIEDYNAVAESNNSAQFHFYQIVDSNQVLLEETKVSNVYEKVNTGITVSDNLKEIVKLGLGEKYVDGQFLASDTNIDRPYLFPIYFSLMDAINFLLPFNITEKSGLPAQMFLRYDYHGNQMKNFTLVDLFLQADNYENNLETFYLGANDGPRENSDQLGDVKFPQSSFVPIQNSVNNLTYNNVDFKSSNEVILPMLVSNTTDPTNSNAFTYVDLKKEIENFQEKVITKLSPLYGSSVKLNIDLDQSKLNKQNYRVMTSPFSIDLNVKVAKAQMYNSFLMHNMSMTFVTDGQPYREPGKFITIGRESSDKVPDTIFSNKIFGQWLVTQVQHIITGDGKYKNIIQCVKPFINKLEEQ